MALSAEQLNQVVIYVKKVITVQPHLQQELNAPQGLICLTLVPILYQNVFPVLLVNTVESLDYLQHQVDAQLDIIAQVVVAPVSKIVVH
jgi:hypothetical protein